MIIGKYDLQIGISVGSYPAEDIEKFTEAGFTHFEVHVPARLPDPNPLAKSPEEKRRNPYTYDESFLLSCRGQEQQLIDLVLPVLEAAYKSGKLWSIHLPFGGGWDIAHYNEQDRQLAVIGIKNIIDLTIKYSPKIFVIHTCLEPVQEEERAVRTAHAIASLREIKAYAESLGCSLALENLPRSCLGNNSDEMLAMVEGADVPVCFDVNHLLDDTHENFLNKLQNRIITTHLSDYDGVDERHWLPGKGIVPWKMLVDRLLAAGYTGPFLFELAKIDGVKPVPEQIISSFTDAVS